MYTSKFPTQLCSYSSLSNFQYRKVYNGITRSKNEGIQRYLNLESYNQRCYCTAKTLVYFQEYYNEKIKQPRKVPFSCWKTKKNRKQNRKMWIQFLVPFRRSIVLRFPIRFDGGDRKHRQNGREKEGVSSNVAGRGLGALMGGVH